MLFAAPGKGLLTTDPDCRDGAVNTLPGGETTCSDTQLYDGNYTRGAFGTSFAAPFVAGTAALVLATEGSLSPSQVEIIMCATSRKLPNWAQESPPEPEPECGLVDAGAAVYVADGYVWVDGFETGDTNEWSSTVP